MTALPDHGTVTAAIAASRASLVPTVTVKMRSGGVNPDRSSVHDTATTPASAAYFSVTLAMPGSSNTSMLLSDVINDEHNPQTLHART